MRDAALERGRLERELRDACDLTLEWYDVLLHLHASGGPLRVGELRRELVIAGSSLTRLLDRMQHAGLVRRLRDPHDRRATLVELSEAGERRYLAARPVHREGIERLFTRRLRGAEADVLAGALLRLHAELS